MKVILKQDVPDVGKKMQIIEVKDGYAQNYLFRKKLAVPATDENMKALEAELAEIAAREAEIKAEAEKVKEVINLKTYALKVKCGSSGKLYGAITNQEIADCIGEKAGVSVDKRKISFDTIKSTGNYEIKIKLHPQVEAKVFLSVEAAE